MLIYKIVDNPIFIGDFKILEINTDSLIAYKNNEKYQIPYYDIKAISVFTQGNKQFLKIIYSSGNKSKKEEFVIGNVKSPQIIVGTIQKNIQKEKNLFSAIKIDFGTS